MVFEHILPYLRYVAAFSYYPDKNVPVAGYDNRLFYVKSGNASICFEDTRETLSKNTLIFIPSGVFYRFENFERPIELLCFNFDVTRSAFFPKNSVRPTEEKDFDASIVFEKDKPEEFARPIYLRDASAFYEKLYEIVREFTAREDGYREKSQALFTTVLITLCRLIPSEKRKEDRLVSAVRDYLNDHFAEDFRAETLETVFHYHPNYVNRVFKDTLGTTIHNYLIARRIEVSKQLLVSTNLTLEEIAQRIGFKTHPHFSQTFRRITGVSPKEYRLVHDRIIL